MENCNELDFIKNQRMAFLNLGCKVNAYETEAMRELFAAAGAAITDFEEEADVYVINTCTVTNIADRKSRQMLHKAKHKNLDAVVVAVGCYVQAAGKELLADSAVDVIIGTNHKREAVEIVAKFLAQRQEKNVPAQGKGRDCVPEGTAVLSQTEEFRGYESLELAQANEKTRAYLKVQDGCNQFCSYCIIPYTRGRIRSRADGEAVDEAKRLADRGYRELVLTGIHLSSYGLEQYSVKEQAALALEQGELPLLGFIRKLSEVEGIERIRLGSLEPRIITEAFVKELAKMKKLCPHFHLSLQSGCNATLARMNRKYTTEEYLNGCELLRTYLERPAVTTDVIVGFPGETEEEFEETKQFLRRVGFAQMHIFKFSPRKGTVAAKLSGQVPEPVKAERSACLIALERQMREAFEAESAGHVEEVLFEEAILVPSGWYMTGHTKRYEKIAVFLTADGKNFPEEGNTLHNQIQPVLLLPERISGMLLGILQRKSM